MKFKGFNEFKIHQVLSDNNYSVYEDAMKSIDALPVNEYGDEEGGLGSKIANWLFVAPKIKRLMGQANQARLTKVKIEADRDQAIRKYNQDFEADLDETREHWKETIAKLKQQNKGKDNDAIEDKIDRFKRTLAEKLRDMKDAHKGEIEDIEDAFDRKMQAADDDIDEIEKECDELAGSNEYLNKIKRTVKLKGTIEADKAKMATASDTEANTLADKVKRYKKELDVLASDIKDAIDKNKDDISWSQEQR